MRRFANHTIELVVATVLAVCATPTAQGAEKCTTATLKGNYGGILSGTLIGVGPLATVATVTFDGAGGWFYDETGTLNGNPFFNLHFTGTYTVTSNCAGTTKDSGGNNTAFVILGSGKDIEIMLVGTDPGIVFTIILKKRFGSDD